MVDDARVLIDAIGYDGPACVQFLHDEETGRRMFLEINPRLDANVRSVRSVGLDLPLWFLDHRSPTSTCRGMSTTSSDAADPVRAADQPDPSAHDVSH